MHRSHNWGIYPMDGGRIHSLCNRSILPIAKSQLSILSDVYQRNRDALRYLVLLPMGNVYHPHITDVHWEYERKVGFFRNRSKE